MTSNNSSIETIQASSFSGAEPDHSSFEHIDISVPDWTSSSFGHLQEDSSFLVKSPATHSHTIEDMVLEFEESGQEIGSILNFDASGIIPDTASESVCSVISDIQIKCSRTRRSDTPCDEDENIIAISPNKMHSSATTTEISSSFEDPLFFASPLVGANADVITSEECQSDIVLVVNCLTNTDTDEPMEKTDSLTKRLAKVSNCQSSNESDIVEKATATVNKLRQQSCDLMSSYAQLKNKNEKLFETYKKLQSETNQPSINIEVLIPSNNNSKSSNAQYLYNCFPLDEDSLPFKEETELYELQVRMDDSYENYCDVLDEPDAHLPWPMTNDCPKALSTCRFGCVCSSLHIGRGTGTGQCRNPACMLEPKCTEPKDPSHPLCARFPIIKGLKSQNSLLEIKLEDEEHAFGEKCNRPRANEKTRKSVFLGMDDPKLKQQCYVQLTKLKMGPNETFIVRSSKNKNRRTTRHTRTKPVRSGAKNRSTNFSINETKAIEQDWKLNAELSVRLKRISVKPGCSFYCMEHQKRGCSCLLFQV